MKSLRTLCAFLESIAPLHLQESYDNAGLIVGDLDQIITGVTVCLDSTEAVIDEAIERGDNVVVAHHPIVFSGLKSLTGANYIERTVIKAIKHGIAIYAIHTNLDNVLENGVNERIAQVLGLEQLEILAPKDVSTPTIGAGIIGHTTSGEAPIDFLKKVQQVLKVGSLKYTEICRSEIRKVAICGGSGSFLLEHAKRASCDIFITSDFKYHQFFDANKEIIIADVGHFESEQYTIDLIKELINNKFSNFAARCTNVLTNPINYL